MSKTIVGLFEGADKAQSALQDLKREGLSDAETCGSSSGHGMSGIRSKLTQSGVPGEEADQYAEGVQRGGTLVLVRTDDTSARRAAEIMERHKAPGTDASRSTGTAGRTRGSPGKATAIPGRSADHQEHEDVVEEEMHVSKRPVERKGARVSTSVSEPPVQENVDLHEEQVSAERSAADRPATARDKVRRKDVHVDRGEGAAEPAYGHLESAFRERHRKHDKSGMSYEEAAPAYRYGADLAEGTRFKGKDWSKAKSDVRSEWEKHNPDTWNEAEPAIRFGWEMAHGKI